MKEQQYILKNAKSFELKDIFDCGQCFRWNKESDESYTGVFKQNVINVKKQGQDVYFKGICSGDIKNVVTYYFDLERDYENIKKTLSKVDINMKTSIEYGKGIRILNQDLWETIISFIISANNNIPRIKGIIEKLSKTYGNEIIWNNNKYYTFPSVNQLKDVTIEQYRKLGLGFRDIRLYETTQMILNKEIDLEYLKEEKDTLKVREELLKLSPCRLCGPEPNEIGNLCIAGHNYDNGKFFSNISKLSIGDKMKIYDLNNNFLEYRIYDKFEVEINNTSVLNQYTNGKKELTLITCNNKKKNRFILKAKEMD